MPQYTFKQRFLINTAPPMAAAFMRALAMTWRITEHGESGLSVTKPQSEPRIYVYWHEFVLPAVGSYRDQPIHPFASKSFDGELISQAMRQLGFAEVARGSSSRGGAQGLLEMLSFLDKGEHVSITVDGPRGPRRIAQQGAIKLAQMSGRAVVPFSFACKPALRLKSWDRMLLPLPFMRVNVNFGGAIRVPKNAVSLAEPLARLQSSLDKITLEAEASNE